MHARDDLKEETLCAGFHREATCIKHKTKLQHISLYSLLPNNHSPIQMSVSCLACCHMMLTLSSNSGFILVHCRDADKDLICNTCCETFLFTNTDDIYVVLFRNQNYFS